MNIQEEWKSIPNYEDYKVSNLGRVKSLKFNKEKILKQPVESSGYNIVNLSINNKKKPTKVHQLIAIAFLNHKPNGNNIVVDHINNNKLDNRVENLQLITNSENILKGKKRINTTSKYKNVCWNKSSLSWKSYIQINSKRIHLGYFKTEEDAYKAYQLKLKTL